MPIPFSWGSVKKQEEESPNAPAASSPVKEHSSIWISCTYPAVSRFTVCTFPGNASGRTCLTSPSFPGISFRAAAACLADKDTKLIKSAAFSSSGQETDFRYGYPSSPSLVEPAVTAQKRGAIISPSYVITILLVWITASSRRLYFSGNSVFPHIFFSSSLGFRSRSRLNSEISFSSPICLRI